MNPLPASPPDDFLQALLCHPVSWLLGWPRPTGFVTGHLPSITSAWTCSLLPTHPELSPGFLFLYLIHCFLSAFLPQLSWQKQPPSLRWVPCHKMAPRRALVTSSPLLPPWLVFLCKTKNLQHIYCKLWTTQTAQPSIRAPYGWMQKIGSKDYIIMNRNECLHYYR